MARKKKGMHEDQKAKEKVEERSDEKIEQEEESIKPAFEPKDKEQGRTEELSKKITELEKERDEMRDRYLRTLAEFENYRRRTAQERVDWIKNANETLILKLCDVLDDFERAIQNHPEKERSEHLYHGMESIYRKLLALMKSEGLSKIEAEETEFDPMYHDAVTYTPSDLEKDRIVAVIQNGYILNNKVIRPAKVALSSGEVDIAAGRRVTEEENDK